MDRTAVTGAASAAVGAGGAGTRTHSLTSLPTSTTTTTRPTTDAYPYAYDDWEDGRQRRSSGAGAFAILGFLALGVLALGAGAVLAGVFSSDPGVGGIDPTLTPIPSIQESTQPSESASVAPTSDASTSPSSSPAASGEPVVFPDGFTAEAQTCIPGSASTNGCGSNARSNSGSVWIWVGFAKGTSR